MLTSGLGADIVVVCTHFPLWRVLSMESFQSSTSYESDKLERPTVISNSPGMQPSSAVRTIVNGKVSAFRSTMREPGIKSSAVSSGQKYGELRSDERREGKKCEDTCRSRGVTDGEKT